MKRIILTALAAVMMLCCLTGCGSKRDPKYIGKWEADQLTFSDVTSSEFLGVPISALFRFDISKDGKVEWKSPIDNPVIQNANEDTEIKWKEISENKLQFTVYDLTGKNDPETMELVYRDGKLCIEEDTISITLGKVDEFTPVDTDKLNNAAHAIQDYGIAD